METTTKVTVISSDGDSDSDDSDGIATALPVIIQIKVKPDHRRHNKWRLAEAKKFAKNDERHRSERYLSYRDDFRDNSELTAEYWARVEDTRENWQIFERKPSDQFNQSLRDKLSKSLTEAVAAGSQVTSPRELLQHSSGSECKCDLEPAGVLSEIPKLAMPSHPSSTTSSRCSSIIEQKPIKPLPFSKVIEVTNPNGTLERDSARERAGMEVCEKTGTFISARQSPKWIKAIEQPNKWMRTQEKKINFREPSTRAKQPTAKLDKRPKTSKRIPSPMQSKSVTTTKALAKLPSTVVQAPPVLDYRKIVDALQYAAAAEKCTLLDALRKRLTESRDIPPTVMIEQFVANDLLQLKTNRLLPKLLWPLEKSENALLQQNRIAALLNAIVSFKDGRKYFDGISMVETLSAVATGNSSIERNTLDNLIAVMGKLSINAHHRLDFAKKGLLDWLLNRMSDAEYSGSEYFFKYSFRLLLNLTADPNKFTTSADSTIELMTLILRIYDRIEQQANREIMRKVLSNLCRCSDASARQINIRGIFMEKIKKTNDLTERAALTAWLHEGAAKNTAANFHTFDKDIAYHDGNEVETAPQKSNEGMLDGEAVLRTKFVKEARKKFKPIEIVELNTRNERSSKHVKSHRLLLPLLKHSFSEHTMDFRTCIPRIFPKRKFPAVLHRGYRKLDFSSTLESLPHKRVERRDHDTSQIDPVVSRDTIDRIPRESSAAPFTVLTSDESRSASPRTLHSEFKSNFVEPIVDSLIETIATVHTEPEEILKVSESDSDVVVKEFARNSPSNHPLDSQSPLKLAKRSNIPIRVPPIETDLQALIKSVDGAQHKTNAVESTGGGNRSKTTAHNEEKPSSGDEKDVVIKLYNPEMVPAQRRRSSSVDSVKAIQNKLPPSTLCSKSDDGG